MTGNKHFKPTRMSESQDEAEGKPRTHPWIPYRVKFDKIMNARIMQDQQKNEKQRIERMKFLEKKVIFGDKSFENIYILDKSMLSSQMKGSDIYLGDSRLATRIDGGRGFALTAVCEARVLLILGCRNGIIQVWDADQRTMFGSSSLLQEGSYATAITQYVGSSFLIATSTGQIYIYSIDSLLWTDEVEYEASIRLVTGFQSTQNDEIVDLYTNNNNGKDPMFLYVVTTSWFNIWKIKRDGKSLSLMVLRQWNILCATEQMFAELMRELNIELENKVMFVRLMEELDRKDATRHALVAVLKTWEDECATSFVELKNRLEIEDVCITQQQFIALLHDLETRLSSDQSLAALMCNWEVRGVTQQSFLTVIGRYKVLVVLIVVGVSHKLIVFNENRLVFEDLRRPGNDEEPLAFVGKLSEYELFWVVGGYMYSVTLGELDESNKKGQNFVRCEGELNVLKRESDIEKLSAKEYRSGLSLETCARKGSAGFELNLLLRTEDECILDVVTVSVRSLEEQYEQLEKDEKCYDELQNRTDSQTDGTDAGDSKSGIGVEDEKQKSKGAEAYEEFLSQCDHYVYYLENEAEEASDEKLLDLCTLIEKILQTHRHNMREKLEKSRLTKLCEDSALFDPTLKILRKLPCLEEANKAMFGIYSSQPAFFSSKEMYVSSGVGFSALCKTVVYEKTRAERLEILQAIPFPWKHKEELAAKWNEMGLYRVFGFVVNILVDQEKYTDPLTYRIPKMSENERDILEEVYFTRLAYVRDMLKAIASSYGSLDPGRYAKTVGLCSFGKGMNDGMRHELYVRSKDVGQSGDIGDDNVKGFNVGAVVHMDEKRKAGLNMTTAIQEQKVFLDVVFEKVLKKAMRGNEPEENNAEKVSVAYWCIMSEVYVLLLECAMNVERELKLTKGPGYFIECFSALCKVSWLDKLDASAPHICSVLPKQALIDYIVYLGNCEDEKRKVKRKEIMRYIIQDEKMTVNFLDMALTGINFLSFDVRETRREFLLRKDDDANHKPSDDSESKKAEFRQQLIHRFSRSGQSSDADQKSVLGVQWTTLSYDEKWSIIADDAFVCLLMCENNDWATLMDFMKKTHDEHDRNQRMELLWKKWFSGASVEAMWKHDNDHLKERAEWHFLRNFVFEDHESGNVMVCLPTSALQPREAYLRFFAFERSPDTRDEEVLRLLNRTSHDPFPSEIAERVCSEFKLMLSLLHVSHSANKKIKVLSEHLRYALAELARIDDRPKDVKMYTNKAALVLKSAGDTVKRLQEMDGVEISNVDEMFKMLLYQFEQPMKHSAMEVRNASDEGQIRQDFVVPIFIDFAKIAISLAASEKVLVSILKEVSLWSSKEDSMSDQFKRSLLAIYSYLERRRVFHSKVAHLHLMDHAARTREVVRQKNEALSVEANAKCAVCHRPIEGDLCASRFWWCKHKIHLKCCPSGSELGQPCPICSRPGTTQTATPGKDGLVDEHDPRIKFIDVQMKLVTNRQQRAPLMYQKKKDVHVSYLVQSKRPIMACADNLRALISKESKKSYVVNVANGARHSNPQIVW